MKPARGVSVRDGVLNELRAELDLKGCEELGRERGGKLGLGLQ